MSLGDLFGLDRPTFEATEEFHITAHGGGGWDAVAVALTRLLVHCSQNGLWWATIDLVDVERSPAFAHLGPDEARQVWTEVAGDDHLPPSHWLSPLQIERLRALGWLDPLDEDGMRNFHRSWPAEQLAEACAHTLAALVEVYGFRDDDVVRIVVEPFR